MLRADSRILIVDGQVTVARLVAKIFGLIGLPNADVAFDTPTARDQMEENIPAVVIFDARISPMNVASFVGILRQITEGQALTLMMTTSTASAIVEKAREAGVDGILLKPFTPKDLKTQLALAIEGRKVSTARPLVVPLRNTISLD